MKIPNALTQKVLAQSARGENVEHFESLDDLFAQWAEDERTEADNNTPENLTTSQPKL